MGEFPVSARALPLRPAPSPPRPQLPVRPGCGGKPLFLLDTLVLRTSFSIPWKEVVLGERRCCCSVGCVPWGAPAGRTGCSTPAGLERVTGRVARPEPFWGGEGTQRAGLGQAGPPAAEPQCRDLCSSLARAPLQVRWAAARRV